MPGSTPSMNIRHDGLKAVWRVMWEKGLEDLGTTLEEWKVNAARRVRRLSRIRAEMQRAGSI